MEQQQHGVLVLGVHISHFYEQGVPKARAIRRRLKNDAFSFWKETMAESEFLTKPITPSMMQRKKDWNEKLPSVITVPKTSISQVHSVENSEHHYEEYFEVDNRRYGQSRSVVGMWITSHTNKTHHVIGVYCVSLVSQMPKV